MEEITIEKTIVMTISNEESRFLRVRCKRNRRKISFIQFQRCMRDIRHVFDVVVVSRSSIADFNLSVSYSNGRGG